MAEIIVENKRFKTIEDFEFYPKENETDIDYNNRIDALYEEVTHWLCKETIMAHAVTKGKLYVFSKDETTGEHYITDDDNETSLAWIFVDGDLLVELKK